MARRRNQRLIDQAALQSLVRFGPQLDALDQLTRDARSTYRGTVSAAEGSAAASTAAIKDARPGVAKIYDQAGLKQAGLNDTLMSGDLAGLSGPGTDLIKAEGATEAHLAATHMNEAKVQALQELTNRGLQAQAGRASAVRQARATLAGDLGDIAKARLSLSGQAGAFESATLGDLLETRATRRFTASQKEKDREAAAKNNRADNRTSRANTRDRIQAQKEAAAAKGNPTLPNGVKRATPGQHGTARDTVELALTQAKRLQSSGRSRSEIGQLLIQGRSPQTIDDGKGGKVPVPGVSKVGQLYASVALDILYSGRVSKKNRKLLNARGLTVKGMGFKGPMTAEERKKAAAAVRKQLQKNKAAVGQSVPLL